MCNRSTSCPTLEDSRIGRLRNRRETARQACAALRIAAVAAAVGAAWAAGATPDSHRLQGAEIGFLEDFALSAEREAALQQLIPGTRDYYYYHCLHWQNQGQFDRVEKLLAEWIKRYRYTGRVHEIRNRQALLRYSNQRQASLAYIRDRLKLRFDHQREVLGQKPNLPTRLDPQSISRETLRPRAFRARQNTDGFEPAAFDWLVAEQLSPTARRHLLSRLQRPRLLQDR